MCCLERGSNENWLGEEIKEAVWVPLELEMRGSHKRSVGNPSPPSGNCLVQDSQKMSQRTHKIPHKRESMLLDISQIIRQPENHQQLTPCVKVIFLPAPRAARGTTEKRGGKRRPEGRAGSRLSPFPAAGSSAWDNLGLEESGGAFNWMRD